MKRREMMLGGLGLATLLAGCGVPESARRPDQAGLAAALKNLDPDRVDSEEAERVARISYHYPLELRTEYGVTDGPLLHNTKVNQGLRPRGLCWHWADDLETRLRQEHLETLTLHRAIANHDNLRIEHSTVLISARGASWQEAIVLDPWRYGGFLYWSAVPDDSRYRWEERSLVFAGKRDSQPATRQNSHRANRF